MTTLSLEGLITVGGDEDRALALIDVNYNGELYHWKRYVPKGADLQQFLIDVVPSIESEISYKENIWEQLTPKTENIEDPITGEITIRNIEKDEIVKPDVPDYYALRRNAYPLLSDQMGALYKGVDSQEYIDIQQKVADVKLQYPKPPYIF